MTNDLLLYFLNNTNRAIYKPVNYFEIYEKHFSRFRGQQVNILEIGVFYGGSLQMWRHYFGPKAKVYGLDHNMNCNFKEDQIEVIVGDQGDRWSLEQVKEMIPKLDIVVDDGCHLGDKQIASFEALFPHLADDGIYVCEDLCQYDDTQCFMEYTQQIIRQLHAWRDSFRTAKIVPNYYSENVFSISYYGGMVVIEKRKINPMCAKERMIGVTRIPFTGELMTATS